MDDSQTQVQPGPGQPIAEHNAFEGIIGQSRSMTEVFHLVERVAESDSTVLLLGQTGTGKGQLARSIHRLSERRDKPFVQINCGAIPENLLESELFGHVRGAFTGATGTKTGKFEMADGGTIFLDEIGDMGLDLQVKILRVLEEREFEPVGGLRTVRVNVRIIAATHRDLEEKVQSGAFREDLYYRLYVIPITLPPLVDRKEDIPLLIEHFLTIMGRSRATVPVFSQQAKDLLCGYRWPGNVRELKNLVERMVVLKGQGTIGPEDVPGKFGGVAASAPFSSVSIQAPEMAEEGLDLTEAVSTFEKRLICQSLEKARWVKKEAARLLNVKRTTLVEKIKRYELERAV